MTPDRLAEIRRSAELVAYTERGEFGGEKLATYQLAAHVVPELLAEVERLTALTALCGVRLTPDEHERGTDFARVLGLTLPSLLRSMLLDVLNEAEEATDGTT